jgi:hypothetical protein
MNSQYARFADMISNAVDQEFHKADFTAPCRRMRIDETGEFLYVNDYPYFLERDAFTQIVKVIAPTNNGRNNGVAISDYLWNNKENGIFQYAFTQHILENPEQEFLVRTYDNSIRAFLSPNYAIMNNAAVIMRVAAIINDNKLVNQDFRVVESKIERDVLRVKLIFNDYDSGQYGTGIYFTNSEVGNGSVAFHSLVKRAICDNSLLSADNMSLYHRGDIYNRLTLIEPELINSVNYSAQLMQLLNVSRRTTYTPEQIETLTTAIKERYNLSDDFVQRMEDGRENENNLFGIVNGITYAAKDMKDREHYEQIAAKIMNKYMK